MAGTLFRFTIFFRGLRINWFIVGICLAQFPNTKKASPRVQIQTQEKPKNLQTPPKSKRSGDSLHRGFRISRNHAPNNYFNKTTAFRYLICHQSRDIYYEPTALLLKCVLFSQCDSHCQPDFKRNSRFLYLKFLSKLNLSS